MAGNIGELVSKLRRVGLPSPIRSRAPTSVGYERPQAAKVAPGGDSLILVMSDRAGKRNRDLRIGSKTASQRDKLAE